MSLSLLVGTTVVGLQLFACIYKQSGKHKTNFVDPHQLASQKPADQDLQCIKTGYIRFQHDSDTMLVELRVGHSCIKVQLT